MTLKQWLKMRPRGALSEMARATGIAHQTLRNVRDGKKWKSGASCDLERARLIEAYTGGEVSEAEAQFPLKRHRRKAS